MADVATFQTFDVQEATIADIHAAMRAKKLTCRALVEAYLKRIELYDKQGPALNAIVVVNPNAVKEAEEMDRRLAQGKMVGPLHCVPTIVKDNFETIGLQSAAGSITMQGFVSDKDAFQVKRIKEAGAIVLAKSNMGEFAFSPQETLNSLQGHTRNPYDPTRVPAGSSGGTAAAVAASFGAVGLGSDTGNSIRGPSSHAALVGIRSTMGLTSRAGVIPLSYLADVAGPMARTVADAVAVFQVIVGEDPEDPVTARSRGRPIPNYAAALDRNGLKGTRIGVLRQAYERQNAPVDPEIASVFGKAIADLKAAGAEIVDPANVDRPQRPQGSGGCRGFKYDINEYLKTRGQKAPVPQHFPVVVTERRRPLRAAGDRHPGRRGEPEVLGPVPHEAVEDQGASHHQEDGDPEHPRPVQPPEHEHRSEEGEHGGEAGGKAGGWPDRGPRRAVAAEPAANL